MTAAVLAFQPACLRSDEISGCETCQIRGESLCGALDRGELGELDRLAKEVLLRPGQTLFEQDETSHFLYNVTAGTARLYRLSADGRRQILGFAIPGDFIGLTLAADNPFSVDALTPVTACQFSRHAFLTFIGTRPHLLRKLHALAAEELTMAREHMVLLGRRTAEEKVAGFLMGLRKRWAKRGANSTTVPLPMSRTDIADYLGLTAETVSRMLSRLAKEKALLVTEDGVRFLNLKRLEEMAEV